MYTPLMCLLSALLPRKRGAHRSFPASSRPLRRSNDAFCVWHGRGRTPRNNGLLMWGTRPRQSPRPCFADVHRLRSGPALTCAASDAAVLHGCKQHRVNRATGPIGPEQLVSARGCSVIHLCCDGLQPRHRMRTVACANGDLSQQCGGVVCKARARSVT